jgi:hypothetical protein
MYTPTGSLPHRLKMLMDQRCAWVPIGQLRPFDNSELTDSEIGWRGRLECEFVGVQSS